MFQTTNQACMNIMLNGLSTLIDPASKSFLRLIPVDAQTVSSYSQQNKTTAQSDRLTPISFVCYPRGSY